MSSPTRYVLLALLVGIALLVMRCTAPEPFLRYRMDVEVDTPSGRRSGSSVLEIVFNRKLLVPLPGAGGADWGGGYAFHGEAPFIDLGNGKFLFVAKHDFYHARNITDISPKILGIYRLRETKRGHADLIEEVLEANTLHILERRNYPMLGTFTDLTDSATFIEANPNNISDSFGPGYTIRSITFQAVDATAPLTTYVADRFPALIERENSVLRLRTH